MAHRLRDRQRRFFEDSRTTTKEDTGFLSVVGRGHLIANVVYERWNPNLPYQA
jgi:hypothetical protein